MTVPRQVWVWRCKLDHVVDGDTVALIVDRGYNDFSLSPIRLTECWAPERFTPEGGKAKAFAAQWFSIHATGEWPIVLQTLKDNTVPSDATDKYSRWTGKVWSRRTGQCLNVDLVAAGHATKTREG